MKLASEALDELRCADWQRLREVDPARAKWLKGTRFFLRWRFETLGAKARSVLEDLAETNQDVHRGWLLTARLRMVFLTRSRAEARDLIDEWIFAAATSDLDPFVRVAITFEAHTEAIANTVWLGTNNARLEGMKSTVRLMSHRAGGFRRLQSLLSLIKLVCGRIPIALPT